MRGQGRIFQRRATWWISYYRNGKEFRESSGSRKEADAKRLLRKRLGEIHSNTFIGPQQERVMFSELLDALVLDYENNGRRNLRNVKLHVKHVKRYFGPDRALDVTETRIERYKQQRLSEEAAPATINRELAAMRRAFNLARKRKVVSTVPGFDLLKESNTREGFVERATFERIVGALPADLGDFVAFGYLTAWRRGEISSLTWAEVDLDAATIRLRHKFSKNDRARLVPIAGELEDLLKRRAERRKVTARDGSVKLSPFVFHRGDGKAVGDFRKRWRVASAAAGSPGLFFHDLRRSAVRNMVRAGVPEKVAMEISGHRTRAIFDRYNIVDERDLRDAVERTHAYTQRQERDGERGVEQA